MAVKNQTTFKYRPTGEGALFENAVFNQLCGYGDLAYLAKGNEYEVDFILTPQNASPIGLEIKYHPIVDDMRKLEHIARSNGLSDAWLIGRYPTPDFDTFLWGGLIF